MDGAKRLPDITNQPLNNELRHIEIIKRRLETSKFDLHDEKILQAQIYNQLKDYHEILSREHWLDAKNIIDFYLPGIGIEVKIKGQRKPIYKQCERYCKFKSIQYFILITNRSMGFPAEIAGKPAYVINIAKGWL